MTNYFEQLTDEGKAKVLALLPRPHAKTKTLYRRTDKSGNVAYVAINTNVAINDTDNFNFKKTSLEAEKQYLAQKFIQEQPSLLASVEEEPEIIGEVEKADSEAATPATKPSKTTKTPKSNKKAIEEKPAEEKPVEEKPETNETEK